MGEEKYINFNCPSCGASIIHDPSRNSMYCSFCGHPIIDVRSIIEQQAELELKRKEMEAVRDHEEALNEIALKYQRKKGNTQAVSTIVRILASVLTPILIIAIIILGINIIGNKYKLVGSSAYTEKAFSVTKNSFLGEFSKLDTKSTVKYNLVNSGWDGLKGSDEQYFTETYNKVYNDEHRYITFYYLPDKNSLAEPSGYTDYRNYYYIYVETDKNDRIIYAELWVKLRDETISDSKTLNGYFGSTLPGEVFSIISKRDGNYVLKKFKQASDAWLSNYTTDGDVRFYYLKSNEDIQYIMRIKYD